MPELLLHYIWLSKAFMLYPQYTTDGKLVEVIDVGKHNMDAGPDFFNAKIRIDGILFAGNVEIHVHSSDWYKHGHEKDKAYDNIILHIVRKADKKVYNTDGESIAQCELKYPDSEKQLLDFLNHKQDVCAATLHNNPQLLTENWKETLLSIRLQQKVDAINELLAITQNNWEQAFYITLAHNFGFHTNGVAFELLARETPITFLRKHRDHLFQLEAMLFGQSGLLTKETAQTDYAKKLLKEYEFLRYKFTLNPIDGSIWKMARMRPQNFPHIRIAQFAKLLNEREFLSSAIMEKTDINELRDLFAVTASEYWDNHYTFAETDIEVEQKQIGKSAIDILLINTVVPYMYAYGVMYGKKYLCERAKEILCKLPAENNHIVANWRTLGMKIRSAADSQAFLHLTNNYCQDNRCMSCEVGLNIFSIKNNSSDKTRNPTRQ